MRKLLVFSLILALCTSPAFAKKTPVVDTEGKGYMGTLPDITRTFQTTEPAVGKPAFEKTERFNSSDDIKPAPRDNPAFVNIILKTDKTSPYLNDLSEFIPMLEKIYDSIENKDTIQKFVARVYLFNKTADWMRDKYTGKPEAEYISFKKLMELSLHAQSVSNLWAEAQKLNPYLSYGGSGYIYNPDNIQEQLQYLKIEIEETLVALKEAE